MVKGRRKRKMKLHVETTKNGRKKKRRQQVKSFSLFFF
jgi:hypothetical protein